MTAADNHDHDFDIRVFGSIDNLLGGAGMVDHIPDHQLAVTEVSMGFKIRIRIKSDS